MAALKLTKRMIVCSFCQSPASKKKLYKCLEDDCDEIWCKRCGQISHENIDDHKFDVNADNIEELTFDEESLALQQGMNKVNSVLTTYEEQEYGVIRQTYFGAVAGTASGLLVATKCGLTTCVNNVQISTMLGTIADATADATQIASAVKDVTTTVGQNMGNAFQATVGTAAIGAGIGAVVMAGFEVALHSYRYWNGDIETLDEYKYHIKRGLASSVAMGVGNWGGTVFGATVGSIGGPIGAIIGGVIGGLIGGMLGAKAGRKLFEDYSSDDFIYREQKKREEYTRAALRLFGWMDINVIKDETKFNEREIQKRYRRLAKQYHPDRNGGTPESHSNFHTLGASLGCLLALLKKKDKREVIKKMNHIPAISYQKNIERIKRILRKKKLFYIVNMCHDYDAELTLEALCGYRMNDILELIDEMNDEEGNLNGQRISVRKKNKFVRIVAKDAFENENQ